ncbi:MAG: hypothetical protein JW849_10515 [Phycisphaerae bacterium]|nr:hypothetical protein [Phycisphaerae bacterium]
MSNHTSFNPRMHAIHEARGIILDFLNAVYPNGLSEEQIIDAMLDLDDPQEPSVTKRDLAYLKARELVNRDVQDHLFKQKTKVVRYTLTAKGEHFVQLDKPWDRLESDF